MDKKILAFESLKLCDEIDEKKEKKKAGNSNANANNKSTLSLHISAYENSVETSSNLNSNKFSTNKKKIIGKTSKEIFIRSPTTIIQNPFEFPRQQKEDAEMDPEIMQFKASQRLLYSNELNNSESNNTITISSSEEEDADSDIEIIFIKKKNDVRNEENSDIEIIYIKKKSDVRNEESDEIKAESNELLVSPSPSPQMPMNIQPQQQHQPPPLEIPPWYVRFMSGSSAHLTSGLPLYFPPPIPSSSIPMTSTATNISYIPQQYSQDQQQQYFPRQRPLHHIIPIRPYPPEFNQTTFIRTNNNNNSNPLNLPQSFRARWIFPSQMYGYNFTLSQSYGFVRGEYR
uniref:Uncharacterized protein n=1 Tax=Panagrolaimus sp. PS1159 TaxID=55785 RepID=A0AC35FVX7_9BILA